MKQLPTIIFFGSGPVASATLQSLQKASFTLEAIITKPRPPHHHGSVPVLEFAQKNKIAFFTPSNKTELTDLFGTQHFKSPVGLVVDYGIIISQQVIDAFVHGIVNSHFSLLPEWRGADPITFAVLSGQQQTGVSLMLINSKLDEGKLIAQKKINITNDINVIELTKKLIELSNNMLVNYLPKYIQGDIRPYNQPSDRPITYSRKLTKEDGIINWQKPAEQIEREVRAFQGWPKSKAVLFGHNVIITKTRVAQRQHDGALVIPCGNNTHLEITELKAPSGRTVSGADFLRGYKK